jgi:hypothetical protein
LPKKTVARSLESGQYIDDGNAWHGSPAAKGIRNVVGAYRSKSGSVAFVGKGESRRD